MANQWLRLWHDMPTDPKWRTISRHAGEPISLVQAVYVHLLVDASRNVTRGHATVTTEDLASALDCDEERIQSILDAMQGRVLDGSRITGWEQRQPKREDQGDAESGAKSAAQRKREQREREKSGGKESGSNECHDESRKVTLDKDTDKDKEIPPNPPSPDGDKGAEADSIPKRERKPRIALKTFLERCKANEVKPVTSYAPLMEYVDGIKLPVEFLELAWDVFKREHMPGGANERRLQADWQRHFLNYVSKGYYRLWFCKPDGSFELTSVGQQAKIREAA